MPPDLVSIVVPTRNRVELLERALASVFAQTHRPLEVVVVDDGSTDGTADFLVAARHQASEAGCYFRTEHAGGTGAPKARNQGAAVASGSFVMFFDSDDILYPDAIATLLNHASRNHADICYGRVQHQTADGRVRDKFWGKPLRGTDDDLFSLTWQTMCALYSRAAVERIGPWNEQLRIWQDWEFCIRAIASGATIAFTTDVIGLYTAAAPGSIGSASRLQAAKGQETATWAVVDHLHSLGLLTPWLRRRYFGRLTYFVLTYRAHGDADSADALVRKMRNSGLFSTTACWLIKIAREKWLARRILRARKAL